MNKTLLRSLLVAIVVFSGIAASAEIPPGYYSGINGKKEGALKNALYERIHNFTRVSSYTDLPRYFQVTDVHPNSRLWWDMYSNIPRYIPSFSGMNREHSFPKSWWGGSTTVGAYVDLNHLYPADGPANMAKSNYPLGEVDPAYAPTFENGVTTVGYPRAGQGGGATLVFEPDDEYKGDFARTYFYMATCYQDLTWKYTYMVSQNLYPTLNNWSVNLLLKWHRDDPVSQKEIDRNEAVYSFQNNRNPFIDYPILAEYLWGNRKGEIFNEADADVPSGTPTLFAPSQNMAIDFGAVAIGKAVTKQLYIHGENLRSALDILIYGPDRTYFKSASNSVAANLANAPEGYFLNITYTPTETGNHTANIIISEGGLVGSIGVTLIGSCEPVPTLNPCIATEPSDILSDSYVANWEVPEGEVIDYFIINRTKYTNGNVEIEQLQADIDDRSLLITGFNDSDSETYTVQSVRLGYYSDPSNVITVNHTGVQGVTVDDPLVVVGLEGYIRFLCSTEHTDVAVFDLAGRQVMSIPSVVNNATIPAPRGAYLVTTAQCSRPWKVIVK